MKTLPEHVKPYRCTPVFTEKTIPPGFLKNHNTKQDVWGVIQIKQGELEYTIEDQETHILSRTKNGIVEPTILHHVRPLGRVSFCVQFYR